MPGVEGYAGQILEMSAGTNKARLRFGDMLNERVGVEGKKFPGVDVRPLQLGFNIGFILLGSPEVVEMRYRNWMGMKKAGLDDYLVEHCVRAQLVGADHQVVDALISEDLCAEGWEIFEFNSFTRLGVEPGPVARRANLYAYNFTRALNESDDIGATIFRIKDEQTRNTYLWYEDVYINQFGKRRLPDEMDPFVEKKLHEMLTAMKKSGWTARTESVFFLTRKNNNGGWPFERKVIIGDVGKGVFQGGAGGLDSKHLDILYSVLGVYYSR